MPSTNKLSSRTTRSVAKFLLFFCGLASFGVVTTLIALSANTVYAESSSNTITANLPGSVAIRLLNAEGTAEISSLDFNNLTPTPQGTTASKSFIVDVATSNPTGYKLYMQSDYQDSNHNYTTNLTHTDSDVTDNIPTLVPGSGSSADTKVYWNYVNPLTSATSPIPAYGQPDKIGQYFTATESNQSTIDINVGIDTTIVSGTYENQLLFSAVGNPTTLNYTVSFDTDGGTMAGEDITESAAAGTHSITIPNNSDYIPTKQGYNFTHWQIVIPTGSTATASCNNSNICNPGDNIVIHSGIDSQGDFESTVGLKAIYEQTGIVTISTMQEMSSDLCATSAEGDSVTLTDTRDNNTYTVRKLKDGNCWMTQNLNLQGPVTLTPADSNVSSSWILPTTTTNYYASGETVTVDPNGGNATTLTDKWCNLDPSQQCNDQIVNMYSGVADFGSYYTWRAATAGTGDYSLATGNATSSICPKGWRLPTGGDNSEFQTLYNMYPSSEDMRSSVGPAFVLSGNRSGGNTNNQNNLGIYWSSTANNDIYSYGLRFNSTDVTSAYANHKTNGFTLRCLASSTIHGLTVDPNGGTWEGSTEKRTFTGESGSTKEISSPTKSSTAYTISYDDNSQGATFTSYPTSTTETFTGWSLSGSGSFEGNAYTFGDGSATLTAQYSNNLRSFTLPNILKPDYTCKWAEGSPTGTQYPGGTFRTISGNTTYYAVCTSADITTISTMQEMTTSVCSNSNTGDGNTLTDIRDNNTYTVRKLADNNCWMTQNLRLSETNTLSSDTSNVPSNNTFALGNSTTDFSTSCVDNPQWMPATDDTSLYNSYGNFYNWYATTAGQGTCAMESGTVSYDICPKGWRLPTSGSTSADFAKLDIAFGGTGANRTNANTYGNFTSTATDANHAGFALAGYRDSNSTKGQGTSGDYWPSTASSSTYTYGLYLISSSNNVGPSQLNRKYIGLNIRCLANNPTYTLTINPNGGTYKGSTDVQSYTGTTGETKTVSNPTGPAYNITYDDNNQGATFTTTPATANRVFSSWSLSGSGSFAGGTYEYASGNGMLTAQYDTESNMFILPFISKSGYSCQWAEGSPSGTLHTGGSGYTTVSSDTTFYAVCTNNTFNSISNMQDMTPTICANASTGDAATLTDTRDNKTYTIRKLADGNCWMTQNLALSETGTLSSDTSNVPSGNTFALGNSTTSFSAESCSDNSQWTPAVATTDHNYLTYGNFYNWYSATAGRGTCSTDTGDSTTYDICPKGWRLPTGNTSGDFQSLYDSYSPDNYNNMVLLGIGPQLFSAGRHKGDSTDGQGNSGHYWTSTVTSIDNAHFLVFNIINDSINMNPGGSKWVGRSVRCLAKGYDVNVSNSNTTSSTDKLDIPYGGSKTVTVTPNSGYYLSSVTCPTGYTCSGYNTGTSATGTQTVTVTNDNSTSGGTLSFTGAAVTPAGLCASASRGGEFTVNGVTYKKLNNDKCYTKTSRGTTTWANAASLCPTGTSLPSKTDFDSLVSTYGTGGGLYSATGWSDGYWSSTSYSTNNAYYLTLNSSGALVYYVRKTSNFNVVCIVSS